MSLTYLIFADVAFRFGELNRIIIVDRMVKSQCVITVRYYNLQLLLLRCGMKGIISFTFGVIFNNP